MEGGVHEINVSAKLTVPSMVKSVIQANLKLVSYFLRRVVVPGKR